MMNPKIKFFYRFMLFCTPVLVLASFIRFREGYQTFFGRLESIDTFSMSWLLILNAIGLYLLALTQALPLKKHLPQMKTNEWLGLSLVGEMFNLILPSNAGSAVRMLYLKEKMKFPFRQFLSMSFAILVTGFTMLGIIGTFYFQISPRFEANAINQIFESLFIALALTGISLLVFSEIFGKFFKIKRKYSPKIYLFDVRLTVKLTVIWLLYFALFPIKTYFSFASLGIILQWHHLSEISLILLATTFVQILPGNIGIKEILTAYMAQKYGIKIEAALLISLIDRISSVLIIAPFGFYFYWHLFLDKKYLQFVKRIFYPITFPKGQSEQTSP